MALIITTGENQLNTVRIEGTLSGPVVHELVDLCKTFGRPPVLDLTDLIRADESGVRALKQLREGGAALYGPRPYIAMLLKEN